jgi:hypothetical protein
LRGHCMSLLCVRNEGLAKSVLKEDTVWRRFERVCMFVPAAKAAQQRWLLWPD